MSYITTSKPRGKGLAIWIFLLCAFFLLISLGGKGCARVLVTIRPPLSTWRQEGSDYGFQHYGSQSQMYLDRPVIYALCEQIGPPKTFLHFILPALLQKPNPTVQVDVLFPPQRTCGSVTLSCATVTCGWAWASSGQGSLKLLREIMGPFVQFWWTSFTYGIMRLCS